MPTPTERTPRPEGLNPERPGEDLSHELQGQVKQVAEEAKRQGKEQLESYRQTAADELEKIAEGARAAASELEDQDEPALSNYVLNAAESMYELADRLRGKSIEDLIQQAGRLAHNNPTLFLAGSVALGFGLMRFARASSSRADRLQEETGLGAGQPSATGSMAMGEIPTPVTATPDGSVTSAGRALGRGTHRLPPGELGHGGPGVSGSPLTGASSTPMTGTVTGAAASSNPAAGSPPAGGGAAGGPAGTSMPGTSTAGSPASGTPASGAPASGTPDRTPHVSTPKSDDQGPTGGMQ